MAGLQPYLPGPPQPPALPPSARSAPTYPPLPAHGPVDLAVPGVVMANGGGFERLRRLNANAAWPDPSFIFLTSSARESTSRDFGPALDAQACLLRAPDAFEPLAALRRALLGPGG